MTRLAAVPDPSPCRCGHDKARHEHLRDSEHCSRCDCPDYRVDMAGPLRLIVGGKSQPSAARRPIEYEALVVTYIVAALCLATVVIVGLAVWRLT
jgi:hypothetical protein